MKGIYSALMGVFGPDGDVNEAGLRALIRHNLDHCHVDGLYVNGSTGETFLMTQAQRKETLRIAADEAKGKARLIAQIGVLSMDEIFDMAAYAADLGYDAVSAVTPFYFKYSAGEIVRYYRDIAEKSALKVLAYYIPHLSGVTMNASTLSEILDIPGVAGIKFTSNDFFAMERVRAARPDALILSGFDEMLMSAAVLGTDGAVGSTYNIMGHWAKKVYESARAGDLETARGTQGHMNTVIAKLLDAGLFPTLKAVMALYGVDAGECKKPMSLVTDTHRAAAREIVQYIEGTRT
jgi:N-acetylneuraminate lyase